MTSSYLKQLLNEFDNEFESLIIPFPKPYVVEPNNDEFDNSITEENVIGIVPNEELATQKLAKIESLATEISAERYSPNYNPEICLANLLSYILSDDNQDMQNDFFQLLNQEHDADLEQVLNDFDFYLNNPYKKKAEKILSKIEAKKNK